MRTTRNRAGSPHTLPLCLACLWLVGALAAFAGDTFTWTNVRIGGGGYITGLIVHPLNGGLLYARTDIGGAYRWDATASAWIALTDWIPYTSGNLYSIESLAVDPSDTNVVYIACGKRMDSSPHGIYKSINRGGTWTGPYLTTVPMGGNDSIIGGRATPFLRNAGERLAVDPNNGNILYFGSRSDGLWKSSNAGVSWTKQTIPSQGNAGYGVSFVAFDPTSSRPGTACTRVYYGAFGTNSTGTDGGIYRSTNSGLAWTRLAGVANQPRRGQVSKVDGTLWVTHQAGVEKAGPTDAALTSVTPSQAAGVAYNGLALDPSNAAKVVVIRGEMNSNATMYRTTTAGAVWSQISSGTHVSSVPWWIGKSWLWAAQVSACVINPDRPAQLWYGDWYGVWKTDDYAASSPTWNNYENGHEEVVTFTLIAPPSPSIDLISGGADMEGFRHNNGPDSYPSHDMGTAPGNGAGCDFQASFGLAYCERNPSFVVRGAGSQTASAHGVCVSTDNGASWHAAPGWVKTDMPRRVAISASNTNTFVVGVSGGKPKRTGNGGLTFTACNGIAENGPAGPWETSQPLCADKVDGDKFYYFVSGKLYRSTDGGQNFTVAKTGLPTSSRPNLKAGPGVNGELWLSLDANGLWKSTDSGTSFIEVRSPAGARISARAIGFGRQASGTVPWLYFYGTLDGVAGVHLSKNRGSSWVWISSATQTMGCSPSIIEPSRQIVGRVYLGTGGRGIFQGNGNPPASPTGLAVVDGDARITLSWNAVSGATSYTVKRSLTSGGTYTICASPTGTNWTDTGLTNGTYYYVVSAVNDYGESGDSSPASASIVAPRSIAIQGRFVDGRIEVVAATVPQGQICILQVSTNLVQWTGVMTNLAQLPGSVVLSDQAHDPLRFYRIWFP